MVRIITDPADREGLTAGTVVDWIETIAIAPFLFAAVVAVMFLATHLRRSEPHSPSSSSPGDRPN